MKKKKGLIEACMRNYKLVTALVVALMIVGAYSLVVMPKQEFPPVAVRQGLVAAVYPGATTEEVEEQVTKPLERYLFSYKEVKRNLTYSKTRDGVAYVMVMLNDDVDNKDEVWSKIKHGLKDFKMQLPAGVMAVMVNDDFGETSALLLALESEEKTYREMEEHMDRLEDKLRGVKSVSNIRRYGMQNEQISVYLDKDKLAAYGIANRDLVSTLFSQGFTTSGGSLENDKLELPVHVKSPFSSEKEVADQIVYSDPHGNIVRLKDIARIVREYKEPTDYIVHNGKRSLILSLEMREGENIVEYGEEVDEVLKEFQASLPDEMHVSRIVDQPELVEDSVYSFLKDLLVSIVIVVLVMMALFPFRSAVVSGISIPVSIFISIAVMYACGIPINTVTLASLIVVLGMLVDNSIIVVDAYLEKLDQGVSRWYAAISSAKEYFPSIALATLCICTIFFPILVTSQGIIYDFVFYFPFTLAITLTVSLAVAMLFMPYLEYLIIRKGLKAKQPKGKKKGFNFLDWVQKGYEHILDWVFRFPKATIALGVLSVIVAGWMMTRTNVRMLPIADRDQFAVEIYLPYGSSLNQTAEVCDSLYHILKKDERIKSVTSFVGASSPRFQATYTPNFPAKNYAQFIVNTTSIKATEEVLDEYADRYAYHFPEAYVRFRQLDYQVTYTPLEVRFIGEDMDVLKDQGDKLISLLNEKVDGLTWIHGSSENSQPVIDIDLKPVEASRLGITKGMVSADMAMKYSGLPVGSVWEGDYDLPILLKSDNGQEEFDRLEDEYVSTLVPGVTVPLRQVADVKPAWQNGQIYHVQGERVVSVHACPQRGYDEGKLLNCIREVVEEEITPQLPEGVRIKYGGAYEIDSEEIIPPVVKGVLGAMLIVYAFLLINFKKVSLATTALLSLSLCMLGVMGGLWIYGLDFGTTVVLGIVSLMGIISRNAIIMFEHAEHLRREKGFTARDAAYDAGKRRMLPIFLTSATTAFGVIPMIISKSSLWEPMGVVIFAGTIVATFMVVTVLPVTYWKIHSNK